jgi:hypothetical protein
VNVFIQNQGPTSFDIKRFGNRAEIIKNAFRMVDGVIVICTVRKIWIG